MKFKNNEELAKAYDELEKAYTRECQENKKLKEQLKLVESEQDKFWQPEEDEEYWAIADNGDVWKTYNNTTNDREAISYGNYFATKEEAEKQTEYNRVMNRFRKYVEAHTDPIDWNDDTQSKYFVVYDNEDGKLIYADEFTYKDAFQIYASSTQVLKDAIIYSAGSEVEFVRNIFGV